MRILGTNYYTKHLGKKIHLGKSSAGWKFLFKADPEWDREKALQLWLKRVMAETAVIYDEYGDKWPKHRFLALVMERQNQPHDHKTYDPAVWGPDKAIFDAYAHEYWEDGGFDFTDHEFS